MASQTPNVQYFNLTRPVEYVAHVEINRPDKLNAFHDPMWHELRSVFEYLSSNPDIRCVLISGAGSRAFTAGLDITAASLPGSAIRAASSDPSRKAHRLRHHILDLQSCISSISRCGKPVIALLHGYTYGLGIDLATACDIRLCAADTRFSVKEVDIGLAADVGTLTRLPAVVGGRTSWAKEVCLSGREFGAEEAMRVGFVSGVWPDKGALVGEGVRMAQLITSKSPVAVQGTKHLLDATAGMGVADHLNYTAIWNAAMVQSGDVESAMGAALLKRRPTFEKL